MANRDRTQIREFGTGLRDYLELNGVRLGVFKGLPRVSDLFALFATAPEEPAQRGFVLRVAFTALAG